MRVARHDAGGSPGRKPREQVRIVRPAAANDEAPTVGSGSLDCSDDRCGGQLGQRRLNVRVGRRAGREVWFEPCHVKELAARRFRRRRSEERLAKQTVEQLQIDMTAGRPPTVTIVGLGAASPDPKVEQRVARTGIEARHRSPGASTVMFAIPPMFTTTRDSSAAPNCQA